ncbi:hypothetical protein DFH07DRAFT_212599 [Mycena maculata]|uniref:Uncharacterized protein n=1 Tax=Mycena maculata TaxID=230809 RepID=A0AAD7JU11_9AGAR|nr:hypothetical protein DFH07DRAFT_212599 [Mycena maculata]
MGSLWAWVSRWFIPLRLGIALIYFTDFYLPPQILHPSQRVISYPKRNKLMTTSSCRSCPAFQGIPGKGFLAHQRFFLSRTWEI